MDETIYVWRYVIHVALIDAMTKELQNSFVEHGQCNKDRLLFKYSNYTGKIIFYLRFFTRPVQLPNIIIKIASF